MRKCQGKGDCMAVSLEYVARATEMVAGRKKSFEYVSNSDCSSRWSCLSMCLILIAGRDRVV